MHILKEFFTNMKANKKIFIFTLTALTLMLALSIFTACNNSAPRTPEYTPPTGLTAAFGDTLSSVNLPAGWAWIAPTTSVGDVGAQMHYARFTPADTARYTTVDRQLLITVAQATPTYTIPTAIAAIFGDTLAQATTLPTGWTWVEALTTLVGNAGTQMHYARFTPTDTANFTIVNRQVPIAVAQATPTYTIPTAIAATFGDTLAQATTLLSTGWTWVEALTTLVGNAGTQMHYARFTPTDTANFTTVNRQVPIAVAQATPIYTIPTAIAATFGDTLAQATTLPTGWTWVEALTTLVGNAGTQMHYARFTPNSNNYYTVTYNINIDVATARLTVQSQDVSRTFGIANPNLEYTVSGFILGDTVATAFTGNFTLSTPATIASNVGNFNIAITYGTAQSTNYYFYFINGTLTITPATLTVAIINASRPFAEENPSFNVDVSGFMLEDTIAVINGEFQFSTSANIDSIAGQYIIQVSIGTANAQNYLFEFVFGTLTITRATLTALPSGTQLVGLLGQQLSTVALPSEWHWSNANTVLNTAGNKTFIAIYTPTDIHNFYPAERNLPIQITYFRYITSGREHSLAIDNLGNIWSWGNATDGRLGHGPVTAGINQLIPRMITLGHQNTVLPRFVSVAAGDAHSLALCENGRIWTFGVGAHGRLGHSDTVSQNRPHMITSVHGMAIGAPISAMPLFTTIAAGHGHSMAICSNGHMWTWGHEWNGALGHGAGGTHELRPRRIINGGDISHSQSPLQVTFIAIAGGSTFSLAICINNRLWSFGHCTAGSLGQGTGTFTRAPWMLPTTSGLVNVATISAGFNHALAICNNGNLWGWGSGLEGRNGHASPDNQNTPRRIMPSGVTLPAFRSIAAGRDHSAAVGTDGSVWTWGRNAFGSLGHDGTNHEWTPRQLNMPLSFSNASLIRAGGNYTIVLSQSGSIWSFGEGMHGRTGLGSTNNVPLPAIISTLYQPVPPTSLMPAPVMDVTAINGGFRIQAEEARIVGGRYGLYIENSPTASNGQSIGALAVAGTTVTFIFYAEQAGTATLRFMMSSTNYSWPSLFVMDQNISNNDLLIRVNGVSQPFNPHVISGSNQVNIFNSIWTPLILNNIPISQGVNTIVLETVNGVFPNLDCLDIITNLNLTTAMR